MLNRKKEDWVSLSYGNEVYPPEKTEVFILIEDDVIDESEADQYLPGVRRAKMEFLDPSISFGQKVMWRIVNPLEDEEPVLTQNETVVAWRPV